MSLFPLLASITAARDAFNAAPLLLPLLLWKHVANTRARLSRRSLINFKCSAIKATARRAEFRLVVRRRLRARESARSAAFCASGRLQRTQIGALEAVLETFLSRQTVISASKRLQVLPLAIFDAGIEECDERDVRDEG